MGFRQTFFITGTVAYIAICNHWYFNRGVDTRNPRIIGNATVTINSQTTMDNQTINTRTFTRLSKFYRNIMIPT